MKLSSVTRNKALVGFSVDELCKISEALDAVIGHQKILDKSIVPYSKDAYQEVHEELCEIIISITDDTGGLTQQLPGWQQWRFDV